MEKILTVPREEKLETCFVTGNHFISLPEIDEKGNIVTISAALKSTASVVELNGSPLLGLFLRLNGKNSELCFTKAAYEEYFIPTYYFTAEGIDGTMQIYVPEGIQGFVYQITLSGAGATAKVETGLRFALENTTRTIFHSYSLACGVRSFINQWTGCAVVELTSSTGLLAVAGSGSGDYAAQENEKGFTLSHEFSLEKGQQHTVYYYIAAAKEADGAALHNMGMRRRGGASLYSRTKEALTLANITLKDKHLEKLANLNGHFCYYFSAGYTLDTAELVLMTSKSHRYYVSAAFWARDTFLWAFPSLLRRNVAFAKEVLLSGFTTYIKKIGIHALYIDGTVLYPGFELDELCAILIALERYITATKDEGILAQSCVQSGIKTILTELGRWYNNQLGLYATELNPSDDPVQYPYLTYCNVLAWKGLKAAANWGFSPAAKADLLKTAIIKNCIAEKDGKKIYAWAVNEQGGQEIYDNPPGSLVLLSYYGFCSSQEEIYRNTVEYCYSSNNPYFYQEGEMFGQGCEHVKHPWIKSICSYLLANGRDEKFVRVLQGVTMDNYILSESFDVNNGTAKTGVAFATMAGFLSNTILEALE